MKSESDSVHLTVEDEGPGIPPAHREHIFDRFYRTGRDVQRQAGLGLGLFIVRALVSRTGGRVDAWSGGPGAGSRFRVVLRSAPGLS